MYGDSLSEGVPSRDPSKALFSEKADGGESSVEKSLPPPILTEVEIEASHERRECVDRFFRMYR